MTLDLFFSPNMQPFAISLGLVIGMVLLELVLMLAGVSILGGDNDVSIDAEPGLDAEVGIDPEFGLDAEPGFEAEIEGAVESGGAFAWLGLGDAPFAIWFAGLLTAFGLLGYALQGVLNATISAPLSPLIASLATLPFALAVTARFARFIGRMIPKFESTAISTRSYGGRRGVITVGTARRGNPAQARIKDGYGNTHYTMVEPLKDDDSFPQGTEIATVRLSDGSLRAISLEDSPN